MVTTVWGQEKMHPLPTFRGKKIMKIITGMEELQTLSGFLKNKFFCGQRPEILWALAQWRSHHWHFCQALRKKSPTDTGTHDPRSINSPPVSEASIPNSSKLRSVAFQWMKKSKMSILWNACVTSHSGHSPHQMRKRSVRKENPQMQKKLQLPSQSKHFTGWNSSCFHTIPQFKSTFTFS